jgi:stage III sporulation protein AC
MDINIVFKIASIGIIAAILHMVLEKANKKHIAEITSIAAVIVALYMMIQMLVELLDQVKSVFSLQ